VLGSIVRNFISFGWIKPFEANDFLLQYASSPQFFSGT